MAASLCNFNTASSWLINGALDSSMVAATDVKEPADVGLGSPWMATSFDKAVVELHFMVLMKSSSRGDFGFKRKEQSFMAASLCNFNTASSWLINGALDSSIVAATDVKEPADVGLGSPWMATSFDKAVVELHFLVLMKSSSRGDFGFKC
ncbi:hypothetical protein Dimus_024430 [Dionaea muscipula]